jgi:predicted RNA-binding Zn-ribbon protein involved in translation (DUF1610 family)
MSWICPLCNQSNADNSMICVCGHAYSKTDDSLAKSIASEDNINSALKSCPSCGREMPATDKFCPFCGKSIVVLSEETKKAITTAAKWILAVSIMFVIFGTIIGFVQKSQASKAMENLAQYGDSEVLQLPNVDNEYTVAELKAKIDQEVIFVFLSNYFLALVMFGLYLWARRSPFPAMITALCVYLAVMVLSAIVDPKTLVQGIVIKIIFIGALIAGIKASLVTRSVTNI